MNQRTGAAGPHEEKNPVIASWMTTNRCNLKCSHCYQDAGDAKTAELTTEEGRSSLTKLPVRVLRS